MKDFTNRSLRWVGLVLLAVFLGAASWSATSVEAVGGPCPPNCPPKPPHPAPPGFTVVLIVVNVTSCTTQQPTVGATVVLSSKKDPTIKVEGKTDEKGQFAAWIFLFGSNVATALPDLQVTIPGFEIGQLTSFVFSFPFFGTFISISVCVKLPCQLDLDIYTLDGKRVGDDEEGEPEREFSVGSQNCVNNDNDDTDALFDRDDATVGSGDNDLVKLIVRRPRGVAAGLVILASNYRGTGRVRVWESPAKVTEVTLPRAYFVSELDKVLWVEGVTPSTAQRDVVFVVFGDGPLAHCKPDFVSMTVIGVAETDFIGQGNSVNDDNNLDANNHPTAPVGKRVFPDARAPRGGAPRDLVNVKINLTVPAVYPLNIYVRPLDVDDPSAKGFPLDPNDAGGVGNYPYPQAYSEEKGGSTLDTTNIPYTPHEDNRGVVGVPNPPAGLKSGRLQSPLQNPADAPITITPQIATVGAPPGVPYRLATVTFNPGQQERNDLLFQVTMQPGDNFRLGFTCDPLFLNRAINQDNRGHGVGIRNFDTDQEIEWQSPVLTIWRRLHVERDSMEQPLIIKEGASYAGSNSVTGMVIPLLRVSNLAIVGIDQPLADEDQYVCPRDRFSDPCRLQQGGIPYNVVRNFTFMLALETARDLVRPIGSFLLHDDDEDTLLPAFPDTSLMQESDNPAVNLFSKAYVRPTYNGAGGVDERGVYPFTPNTEYAEVSNPLPPYYANRQSIGVNTSAYWAVYMLSLFQAGLEDDNDPDDEGALLGICALNSPFDLCDDVGVVYLEGYRDGCGGISGIKMTVVHEVGHSFGGRHMDGGIMAQGCEKYTYFSDMTLNRIRSSDRPGGGPVGGIIRR